MNCYCCGNVDSRFKEFLSEKEKILVDICNNCKNEMKHLASKYVQPVISNGLDVYLNQVDPRNQFSNHSDPFALYCFKIYLTDSNRRIIKYGLK